MSTDIMFHKDCADVFKKVFENTFRYAIFNIENNELTVEEYAFLKEVSCYFIYLNIMYCFRLTLKTKIFLTDSLVLLFLITLMIARVRN
jgi:hypothetical protein